jgi:nucleotide-binding universal stress UspA family protein
MDSSILVPLDGSVLSEHALPLACDLALRTQAILRLVHVHTLSPSPISIEGQPVIDEHLASLSREHERTYLERIKHQLAVVAGPQLQLTVDVLDRSIESIVNESVAVFLANYVLTTGVDLVVMTTHGRSGLARFWLGSVADTLVRLSRIPILLLRPTEHAINYAQPPSLSKILIPLDGSGLAEQILEPAVAVGDLMQAEYTLLRVVKPAHFASFSSSPQLERWDMETNRELETQAANYLNRVAQRLQTTDRRMYTRVLFANNPASAILEEAQQQAMDLIALATHGRSGWARFTLGSVADKVLRGATVPVLVYRPSKGGMEE